MIEADLNDRDVVVMLLCSRQAAAMVINLGAPHITRITASILGSFPVSWASWYVVWSKTGCSKEAGCL
jgi:hypothetical protein